MNVMREQLDNLKVESNKRQQALKEAATKEAEITRKLGESNKSIENLTKQRKELLEKGELNATEKANLERIRKELTDERNAKKNEISRLQTLSNNREKALKEISTKLNVATRNLTRSISLVSTQEKSIEAKNKNLKTRQNQVGELYREQEGLKKLIETLKTQATQTNAQIQQQTTNLATSASEINRLQGQLTNATKARTRNIENMQMRHAEKIRAATDQIQALTKNVQERNAIIQRSKVVGKWQGASVRGLGTQLKNTQTNLTKAQKEIGVARSVVTGLQGQRNALGTQLNTTQRNLQNALTNVGAKQSQITGLQGQRNTLSGKLAQVRGQRQKLRSRNKVSRGVITGLQGQRNTLQRERNATIGQLRTTQGRLSGVQGKLNLTRGQLRNAQGRLGGTMGKLRTTKNTLNYEQNERGQLELREQMRQTIYKQINNLPLWNTRKYAGFKKRIIAAKTVKQLENIAKDFNKKNNFKFGNNTRRQPIQTREQVTFGGFAAGGRTGLDNTTRATGNTRSRTS